MTTPSIPLRQRLSQNSLLSGSAVLLVSMTIVNAGNYLFNLVLGRWLGRAAFADLSLMVTLMLMVTFFTATLQLTAAKFAATHLAEERPDQTVALRKWMGRYAWIGGTVSALIVAGGSPFWQSFFNTASPWPFVILGLGMPIYFAQGVDRGILQGQMRFGRLSASYQAEMWVRLVFGLLFVTLGWSVNGAVLAITMSFIATWLVAQPRLDKMLAPDPISEQQRSTIMLFAWPVIVVQISQILINNSDIIITKRFFEPEAAGEYAALALIGRVVFFATWSVVTTLFPIVAKRHASGESHRTLLWGGLGIVTLISSVIVAMTVVVPDLIVMTLFGEAYLGIAPVLWRYAVATMLYAMANVIVNYRLSADKNFGTYLATLGGVMQVVLLWIFHDSIVQVVNVQIAIMSCLIVALLIWDGVVARQTSRTSNA